MYIVAIAWGYVILMMTITADSLASGIATALFLGVLPISLFVFVADSGHRRRRREAREAAEEVAAGANSDAANALAPVPVSVPNRQTLSDNTATPESTDVTRAPN